MLKKLPIGEQTFSAFIQDKALLSEDRAAHAFCRFNPKEARKQMNFVISGTENIPTYLAIIGFTFVFSLLFWKTLFSELDVYEIKYTKKLKRRSLWLIFSNLLLLIIWWQVLQQLLSRLQ